MAFENGSYVLPPLYQKYGIPSFFKVSKPNYGFIYGELDSIKPVSHWDQDFETIFVPIFEKCCYMAATNRYHFYWFMADGMKGCMAINAENIAYGAHWTVSVLKYNFPDLWKVGGTAVIDKLCKVLEKMVDAPEKKIFDPGGEVKFLYEENPADFYNQYSFSGVSKDLSTAKHEQELSRLASTMPGAKTIVDYPCDCPGKSIFSNEKPFPDESALMNVIMHLNDFHEWSRQKIADWIDELHDKGTINAEFESWNDNPKTDEQEIAVVSTSTLDGWKSMGYTVDELSNKFMDLATATVESSESMQSLAELFEKEITEDNGDSNDDQD